MNTIPIEISEDGRTWRRMLVRPVAQEMAEPTGQLPEGYSWDLRDGRWVPVMDEGALRS